MGTLLKASFASPDGPPSSVGMAAFAAKNCLAQCGMSVSEVDLLINVGVFRDDNIIEPAMAPLIQKQAGLNPDPVRRGSLDHTTLSFDINDGPGGFLTAVRVAESFFKTGCARHALVVGGDIHPSRTPHRDFPFSTMAAAALLAFAEDDGQGFSDFHFKTSSNGSFGFSANVDLMANGLVSRSSMNFEMEEDYTDRLIAFASEMLLELFQSGRMNAAAIDYVVVSQQIKGLGRLIAEAAGLNGRARVIDLYDQYGDAHTSTLMVSYHHLAGGDLLKKNDRILFLSAGSGLSASCALYTV